jgi:hypothetical protein
MTFIDVSADEKKHDALGLKRCTEDTDMFTSTVRRLGVPGKLRSDHE